MWCTDAFTLRAKKPRKVLLTFQNRHFKGRKAHKECMTTSAAFMPSTPRIGNVKELTYFPPPDKIALANLSCSMTLKHFSAFSFFSLITDFLVLCTSWPQGMGLRDLPMSFSKHSFCVLYLYHSLCVFLKDLISSVLRLPHVFMWYQTIYNIKTKVKIFV